MDQDELADKYDAVLNGEKVEDEEQRTYTYIGAWTNLRKANEKSLNAVNKMAFRFVLTLYKLKLNIGIVYITTKV